MVPVFKKSGVYCVLYVEGLASQALLREKIVERQPLVSQNYFGKMRFITPSTSPGGTGSLVTVKPMRICWPLV
jgi:hypothetical protein